MPKTEENETCAICLDALKFRNKKIHRTNCGHCFHETCIEKIKEVLRMETLPTGEVVEQMVLPCPCCRAPIDPTLKQKVIQTRENLKRVSENIHDYANVYNVQMQYHSDVIQNLEKSLRDARNAKKIVHQEMTNANRYLKSYQSNLKTDLANYLDEIKKEKQMRKQIKTKANNVLSIEEMNSIVNYVNENLDNHPPPPPSQPPVEPRIRFRVVPSLSNT